jgi:hypothetical protein
MKQYHTYLILFFFLFCITQRGYAAFPIGDIKNSITVSQQDTLKQSAHEKGDNKTKNKKWMWGVASFIIGLFGAIPFPIWYITTPLLAIAAIIVGEYNFNEKENHHSAWAEVGYALGGLELFTVATIGMYDLCRNLGYISIGSLSLLEQIGLYFCCFLGVYVIVLCCAIAINSRKHKPVCYG